MATLVRNCAWSVLVWVAVGCAVNPVPTPATGGGGSGTANAGGGGAEGDTGAFNQGADAGTTAGGAVDTLGPAMDVGAASDVAAEDAVAGMDSGAAPDAASDSEPDAGPDSAPDSAPDPGPDSAPDPGPDSGPAPDVAAAESLPPTEQKALAAWLAAGSYKAWKAESKVHNSTGPHFGGVKTFVSAKLFESLTQGNATHSVDAATVKELYGSGSTVLGWSVMRKTQAGTGGNTWWWYEDYGGKVYAAGQGVSLCTGCHSPGKDYFLSPFPLQ